MGKLIYCEKCHYRLEITNSRNFGFKLVVTQFAGRAGTFGPEIKNFFDHFPDGALDCTWNAYHCKKCGYLTDEYRLNMCVPKVDKCPSFSQISTPIEFWRYYHMIQRYTHYCDMCGEPMTEVTGKVKVRCPECGNYLLSRRMKIWE